MEKERDPITAGLVDASGCGWCLGPRRIRGIGRRFGQPCQTGQTKLIFSILGSYEERTIDVVVAAWLANNWLEFSYLRSVICWPDLRVLLYSLVYQYQRESDGFQRF